MLPRLYEKSRALEDNNGLGFFNKCRHCDITIAENGDYFLEMTVLPTDRLYKTVAPDLFVKAKPNHKDPPQLFEINSVEINKNLTATVRGTHIKSYFFNNVTTSSLTAADLTGTAAQVVSNICTNTRLYRPINGLTYQNVTVRGFDSDVKSLKVDLSRPTSLEEMFYGSGGVLATFGGEFKFDNTRIYLYSRLGQDSNRVITYGSGIKDHSQTLSNTENYTTVMGYARFSTQNDGYIFVESNRYSTDRASTSFFKNLKVIDFSDKFSTGTYDAVSAQGQAQIVSRLNTLTRRYLNRHRTTLSQPTASIRVTEQSELKKLQDVGLYDTVKVVYGRAGLSVRAKSVKTVYDSILERYKEHELGERKLRLSDYLRRQKRR